jgi:hypothetical protein
MKSSHTRRVLLAMLAAGTLVAVPLSRAQAAAAPPPALLDLMAQGKTETDLGHYDVAIRALTTVVDSPEAPPAFRLEALVRLGVARRAAGDAEGAFQAFESAAHSPALDADSKALLVQALGGAMPGAKRWAEIWPRVSFAVDGPSPKRRTLTVVWPDAAASAAHRGDSATVRFTDADLGDVFRLVADISGLNVVVFPGVHGKVTLESHDEPWDRILDRALSPNGLASQREDNVVLVAAPEQLPPARRFRGQRIVVNFSDSDLRKTLAEIAALGGATVDIDPLVAGQVTIRLSQVRWDQAFDIIVRVNGLDWTQDGQALRVFPKEQ